VSDHLVSETAAEIHVSVGDIDGAGRVIKNFSASVEPAGIAVIVLLLQTCPGPAVDIEEPVGALCDGDRRRQYW